MSIKPKLRLFDLTMITVSLVIGIGIFRTPSIVAQKAETPMIFFAAWILGGIVSICGALTFAEIGSRMPVAGGFYKIFSHCYSPALAFMLNWSLVITNAASAVGVAIVGAEYINPVLKTVISPGLIPHIFPHGNGIKLTAITVIMVLFGLNYLGIKMGARTQNVLSMVKIATILIFCFAIFGGHHAVVAPTVVESTSGFNFLRAIGISLIAVFFTYGGYQNTINFGADIKDAEKNIPKAIFTGIGIVILLYLTINFAYYYVLGFDGVQHAKLLASELAKSFFGEKGYTITSVVIFVSILGFINTAIMSNPRVYYAMADDKILPEIFKRVNSKTMAQEFALTFFLGLLLFSLFLLNTFEEVLNYVMFIDSLSLVMAAGAVFIFRSRAKKDKLSSAALHTGYRIKLFPLVPIIFMIVLLLVMGSVYVSDPIAARNGVLILLGGFPLYLLMKKIIKGKPEPETSNV